MDEMREQFEKLPEIRKIMNENGIYFMNHSGWYEARDFKDFEYEQYINGAWYAFQEQQKQLDLIKKLAVGLRNEFNLWADDTEAFDAIEAQIENLEVVLK